MAAAKIDADRKRIVVAAAQADLELKLRQLSFWRTIFTNPVFLGTLITGFVALNTVILNYFTGAYDMTSEGKRMELHRAALQGLILESELRTSDASIVLKAVEGGNSENTVAKLELLLEIGALQDSGGRIRKYLEKYRASHKIQQGGP